MKSRCLTSFVVFLGTALFAHTVTQEAAKNTAVNLYQQYSAKKISSITLAYAETSDPSGATYYAFNINSDDGFVLIAADDAAHPLIGYSTKGQFKVPPLSSNAGFWMTNKKNEIIRIRGKNMQATDEIRNEWKGSFSRNLKTNSIASSMTVPMLVFTSWSQSPYYNDSCPSKSETGCVATAMSQIIRYWKYPARGTGSNSYCDCSSSTGPDGAPFQEEYGTLSVNFAASSYDYADMPDLLAGPNSAVAKLIKDIGVSVNMDYAPSGSGSLTNTTQGTVCAQNSYSKYFGYNPSTISCITMSNYSDTAWIRLLENEFINGRPVDYSGVGASGGHSWVGDGFDANNNIHLNWGFGGYDNGFFNIHALAVGSLDFTEDIQAVIGIQPLNLVPNDAGVNALVNPSVGGVCNNPFAPVISLRNFGNHTLNNCTINYTLDGGSVNTYNWSCSLGANQSMEVTLPSLNLIAAGTHTLSVATDSPNGAADGNPSNDDMNITFVQNATISLPVMEGFEGSANLPNGWSLYVYPTGGPVWQVVSNVGQTGSNCIGMNNCDGNGNNTMAGDVDRFITSPYDFSNASSASLNFGVAYASCLTQGSVLTDSLRVYYSLDCGGAWTRIYTKGGLDLATAPTYNADTANGVCWAPSKSQWRTESLDLSAVTGQPGVQFTFECLSDWGEWLYIDNINITSIATGIASLSKSVDFAVYPNPASTSITVSGVLTGSKAHYTLCDLSGRAMLEGEIESDSGTFKETINTSALSHSMYFLKLEDGKNYLVRKIVLQ